MHNFLDRVHFSGVRETSEGFLIADAYTVRTGVQQYAGYEVGLPDVRAVNVYRPESEVFSLASLQSFSHVPLTVEHPSVAVTKDNWKTLAVGEASAEVLRDGERLRIPLIVKDKDAIASIKDGKRELSAGYTCELVFEDGIAPDGTPYQAVQKTIRANHIAIVDEARAGHAFRIGDRAANWGAEPITEDTENKDMVTTRTILVDGLSVESTEAGIAAIEKLQGSLATLTAQLNSSTAAHTTAIAAKDTEIGELKVKLVDAEKKVPTGATLDALVTERTAVIDAAKSIAKDLKTDGLTLEAIRKAAVSAALGEDMVKDVSDAEIAGMFKAATKDAVKGGGAVDPYKLAVQQNNTQPPRTFTPDHGQQAYEQRMADAWKTGGVVAKTA